MKSKILLVDDDKEFLKNARTYFENHPGYSVVGCCYNGADAIEKALSLHPDIMVLDMIMPIKDGFSVLDEIRGKGIKVIALSSVNYESYASNALKCGANYFALKPIGTDELEKKVSALVSSRPLHRPYTPYSATDRKITDIFMTVGIPAHIKGFQFLREAIKLAIDCPEVINSITKRLYPEVAERFSTSPSKVERAIRHAIEVAWNKGKIENVNSVFGVRIYNGNEKPTNGEFIALVADKLLLESV